jgi:hypothetical protein
LFVFLAFILSLSSSWSQASLDPQWLNLLRYEASGSEPASFESQVINSDFFLSSQGRSQPDEELQANLREAQTSLTYGCRFPARRLYFTRKGWIRPQTETPGLCPEYEYFKKKLGAEKISVVFASFYLNSPGSAFGHTLIKIQGRQENNPLLAYGANFAANLTTQNPVLYAWNGFTGGFDGVFSLLPYYYKIREYNQSEHRDLWEYPLQLTPDQVELFVAHLWEMDRAKFRYYYLTRNCSYHLLKLLDAVNPSWQLTQRLPTVVMPTQALRVLQETPGLMGQPRFRPSQFTVLESRYRALSPKLRSRIATDLESISRQERQDLSAEEWTQLLDFTADYLDARYAQELLLENTDPAVARAKNQILSKRSELPPSIPPAIEAPSLPESGHLERRWGIGFFSQGDAAGSTLQYRHNFHDLWDRDEGRARWSTLVMGDLQLQMDFRKGLITVPHFSLARAQSNPEFLGLLGNISWKWDFGLDDPIATPERDLAGFASGGVGATWINSEHLLVTTFLEGSIRYSNAFRHAAWWPEAGPSGMAMIGNSFGKLGVRGMRHRVFSKAYVDYSTIALTGSVFFTRRITGHAAYLWLPQGNRIEAGLRIDF